LKGTELFCGLLLPMVEYNASTVPVAVEESMNAFSSVSEEGCAPMSRNFLQELSSRLAETSSTMQKVDILLKRFLIVDKY
jgi:hypothetical protein